MSMNSPQLKDILEAALFAASEPVSIERLLALFDDDERPERDEVRAALDQLQQEWAVRSIELKQVASGYRFQVRQEFAPWLSRLSEERAPRYSRALLETLALIVYRQPITRASIEEIRGVTVSTSIIKTLSDRDWIRVVGYRDVPGKPALYGTTKRFLDDFNLKTLGELPPLSDIRPIDHMQEELDIALAAEGVSREQSVPLQAHVASEPTEHGDIVLAAHTDEADAVATRTSEAVEA